jgi:hypothetical protein
MVAKARIQHRLFDLAAEEVAHRVDTAANRLTENAQHPLHPDNGGTKLPALRQQPDKFRIVLAKRLIR